MAQTGVTLKRLEELELNLQAKMRSISKERYIEQMERTFQEFCARARQMFEEEFQQILKSEDTNLANQLYLSMKEDLTQLQAARKKLEFGEQLTFDDTIQIGMLMGRIDAREEELHKQIEEVEDQTEQVIVFDEVELRRSIKTTVSTKKLMSHYKLNPIKKFVRFREFIQSGGWGINKWDAIQVVAKKPIIISAFEAYRHRSDDRAFLRYKVLLEDEVWISEQRIELKDNVKSRHVTKLDFEPLGKAIVLERGQSCHLMTLHERSTRQVQHQQAYNGRNGVEADDEDAIMIRKSKYDENYTTLESGQIPTVYYYLRKVLDKSPEATNQAQAHLN